jgi:signal peptidase I
LIGRAVRVIGPAVLAWVVLAFLVPRYGRAADLVRAYPMAFWIVWFLIFTWVVRHWWPSAGGAALPWRRVMTVAIAAAAGAWSVRTFLAGVYRVTSASMLPTLAAGDVVVGDKIARRPKRGDVVVVHGLVKRVIGLPGDRVAMRGEVPVVDDRPAGSCDAGEYVDVLDGEGGVVHGRLHVETLDDAVYLTVHSGGAPFESTYTVGPDEVFVLGDNRGQSVDSRSWNGGRGAGVPLAELEARIDRFFVGTRRSGDADWSRFLLPMGALERRIRQEGIATAGLEEGISRCLDARPKTGEPFLKIGGL